MATTTTKTSKSAKPDFGVFEAFAFPATAFEVPTAFREVAEKSVSQFRDSYDQIKVAAEDATALVEDTLENARVGAQGLGEKALEAARTNSEASFELARDLFSAKTVSDVVELQAAFTRKQFEAATAQFKELQELGQKVLSDTAKPVADKVEKTLRDVKVA